MIRRVMKTGVAEVLSRSGLDKVVALFAAPRTDAIVIGYHRVVENYRASTATSIPSMLVSQQMLERHLDWIGRRFRFASLDELGARIEGRDASADPIAAVTFDDGYRDFYDNAFPLLKRKGIPAAIFVVTDLVGTADVQLHDKLYLFLARKAAVPNPWTSLDRLLRRLGIILPETLGGEPYQATRTLLESLSQEKIREVVAALESEAVISDDMFKPFYSVTWEMLARIQRAGMTVGSHTRSHAVLTTQSSQRVVDEVTRSREEIEKRLGAAVRHFAYPSGKFTAASVRAVANAGYRFGYTGCSHQDPQHPTLTVPRTLLWENACGDFRDTFSGRILSCQLNRAFDVVGGCRDRHETRRENANA